MKDCDAIRPLLFRVAEGEAGPDEAIDTARHLPTCTACRIILAREQRLAQMLEHEMDDPLVVGEEFVRSVMSRLPSDPPPVGRRRRSRQRWMKLAGVAGMMPMLPALFEGSRDAGGVVSSISSFGVPIDAALPQAPERLIDLGRVASLGLELLRSGGPAVAGGGAEAWIACAVVCCFAMFGATLVAGAGFALLAGSLGRILGRSRAA